MDSASEGQSRAPPDVTARRYRAIRLRVFAATWLAYAGFYLTRKSFSVAKVALARPEHGGFSLGSMTLVDTGYLLAYAVGQFAAGVAGDRFGTRRLVLGGMLVSIVVAVASGCASSVVMMAALLAVQGLCQSCGWAPLAKNVGEFFSRGERGRVMGLWCTNYAIGGFAASMLAAAAADACGWRWAFWVNAAALGGVAGVFWLWQVDRPECVGLPPVEEYTGEAVPVINPTETPAEEPEGSWHVVAEVYRSPMVWLLAAVYFLIKPSRYLVMLWSPLYVSERLGTGAVTSAAVGSMFDLAGPAGVLLGGWLSDRVFAARRIPPMVLCLAGVAALLFAFPFLPDSSLALGTGFFFVGFLLYVPDSLVSGTAAVDFGTKRGASTAAGLINGCGSLGAVAGNALPWLVQRTLSDGGPVWGWVFALLGGSIILAAALLVPQWNTVPATAPRQASRS